MCVTGCMTPRQVMFQMGYMMNKPKADYDAIERSPDVLDSPTAHQDRAP